MATTSIRVTRRSLLASALIAGSASTVTLGTMAQTRATESGDEMVIDTMLAPATLDPALARSIFDWSIIHSLYDSILNLDDDGVLSPLAAESFRTIGEEGFEIVLREGLTYHDGSPVRAEAIARSVSYVQASEGPAAANFRVIDRVEVVDDLTARIMTSEPAPWLPSQLAVWLVLYPEGAEATFETAPIGSGPYRFLSMEPGASIALGRNEAYAAPSSKGLPLAQYVTYRFVPEVATRIADLKTGAAHLIDGVNQDHREAVHNADAEIVEAPVLGISFLRLVNDVPPLDDPRVRQALNYAIDVESIAQKLVSSQSHRAASVFPDSRAIGFDPDLPPYPYDPDRARHLLAEAGTADRLNLRMQYTGGGRGDIMQSIAAYLGDVGIELALETTELTTFNGTWREPTSAELRFVTWRPVYDPHTLLSLMFASSGPLSRYHDEEADRLIAEAAREMDQQLRAARYRDLGRRFQNAPPAVFLWNVTASYGARDIAELWLPRGDEYILAMRKDQAK